MQELYAFFVEKKHINTLLDAAVPKLSSSQAVSVVIFPVTPEIWNNRSPSSCTELNLQTNEETERTTNQHKSGIYSITDVQQCF